MVDVEKEWYILISGELNMSVIPGIMEVGMWLGYQVMLIFRQMILLAQVVLVIVLIFLLECTDMIRDEDMEAIAIRAIVDAAKRVVDMVEVKKMADKMVYEKRWALED